MNFCKFGFLVHKFKQKRCLKYLKWTDHKKKILSLHSLYKSHLEFSSRTLTYFPNLELQSFEFPPDCLKAQKCKPKPEWYIQDKKGWISSQDFVFGRRKNGDETRTSPKRWPDIFHGKRNKRITDEYWSVELQSHVLFSAPIEWGDWLLLYTSVEPESGNTCLFVGKL